MTELKNLIGVDESYISPVCDDDGDEPELNVVTLLQGDTIDDRCMVMHFNIRDEEGAVKEVGLWLTKAEAESLAAALLHAAAKLPSNKKEMCVV